MAADGYRRSMARSPADPTRIPAVIGVQPGAPNARAADDHDLADGPPATDEEIEAGSSGEER
jgi:hypothetical protein